MFFTSNKNLLDLIERLEYRLQQLEKSYTALQEDHAALLAHLKLRPTTSARRTVMTPYTDEEAASEQVMTDELRRMMQNTYASK